MMKNFVRVLALTLVAITLGAALVSCGGPNADPAKAKAALDEANYLVTKTDNDLALEITEAALDIDDLECIVAGVAKDDAIAIYYFEDAEAAREAFAELKTKTDKILENVDEENVISKCSGKMVYFGTKDAVKAAK